VTDVPNECLEEEGEVAVQVDTFFGEVALVEGIHQLVLLAELRVDIRVLEDQSLIEGAEEFIEHVLFQVNSHITSLQGRLLDVAPQL